MESNNEITAYPIKTSWDRDEVIQLLEKYADSTAGDMCRDEEVADFIKNNL